MKVTAGKINVNAVLQDSKQTNKKKLKDISLPQFLNFTV